MHEHDDELIAALAAGHLAADEAASARVDVGSCARCREELATQVATRRALKSLGSHSLTDFERSRLHHVISRQEARPWYFRLAPALGVAVAFIAVVGIGGALLRSESEIAPTSADAVGEESAPSAEAPVAEEEPLPASGVPQESGAAQAESMAGGPVDFGEMSQEDLEQLVEQLVLTDASQESPARFMARETVPVCAEEISELDESADMDFTYAGAGLVGGSQVEIYLLADSAAIAYAAPSCEILAEFP